MSEAWPDERSREAILRAAASLATEDGPDGLSASTLAAVLGRSELGRRVPSGSRQELQLATVTEAFIAHLERHAVPGGCFMASAALAMDDRPGPVRDLIASLQARFGELIHGFAVTALARHELPPDEDPGRLAFELNGIMLATDTNFAEHDDPAVLELARQIVRQRLGVS